MKRAILVLKVYQSPRSTSIELVVAMVFPTDIVLDRLGYLVVKLACDWGNTGFQKMVRRYYVCKVMEVD